MACRSFSSQKWCETSWCSVCALLQPRATRPTSSSSAAVEENEMRAAKPRDGENEQRVAMSRAVRASNTFFMNCHQQHTHRQQSEGINFGL